MFGASGRSERILEIADARWVPNSPFLAISSAYSGALVRGSRFLSDHILTIGPPVAKRGRLGLDVGTGLRGALTFPASGRSLAFDKSGDRFAPRYLAELAILIASPRRRHPSEVKLANRPS
jgi:hypothetical protein